MPDDQTLAGAQKLLQAFPRSCWTPLEMEDRQQAQRELAQLRQQVKQQKR
jgi:hypothetical protein